MKRNNNIYTIIASVLFLVAIGLFTIQMGYLLLQDRLQMEYVDNRLFYLINIFIVIFLWIGIIIIFTFTKRFKLVISTITGLFIIMNVFLLVQSDKHIKNIISISPDFKHVFSIKVNEQAATYYRSYYGIVARPKEVIDYPITGDYHVEWLTDDVAVFTSEINEGEIQAFVGTYGDRNQGLSYYYVGPEIQGVWQNGAIQVVSKPEGIQVKENGKVDFFDWEHIHQFGTLAIVLKQDHQASWVIALNEDFEVRSDGAKLKTESISLYKPAIAGTEAYRLNYVKPYDASYQ